MTRISTVIIAQDEEELLERCVRPCLEFSDEVLVVDGGSRDRTRLVAEALGCRVIENAWPGYSAQRNLGAREAAHDWIFSVDPDETVDEELARALAKFRETGPANGQVAYSVDRINSFMRRWFPESSERKVRLYDRRAAEFTDAIVHEVVNVPTERTEPQPGHVWHDSWRDLGEIARRIDTYTSLEADREAARRPMRLWRLLLRPPLRFGHRYQIQRGYRHGWRGLFFALSWVWWELLREMKVYELRRTR